MRKGIRYINIAQICEFTIFLNLRIVLISPDVFINRNVFCFFLHTDLIDCVCGFFLVVFQVATFILQKILLDETGLSYICQTYERFSHVAMILVSKIR